ncbi:hypothetical protein O6H91_18G068000 [Diphasiastrum complanatum]|uniref:Uncharacterized protein n=1 Tax=Diphasiastrum complanatum TaxID=34168 RepID=A0ACC2B3H4_DIPCM|nr:hypothetical protein O6H91_18G068000 [Diphasiastrum complanatum]
MTSISRSGIGIVTVLAVSGSVIFLAFSKRSIIPKNEFLKQPAIANQIKHETRGMCKVPIAFSCPDQSEILEDTSRTKEVRGSRDCCSDYVMTGTFLSAEDERANPNSDGMSTKSISSDNKTVVVESVGRTAMDQDLTAVRSLAVIQKSDALLTNPNVGYSERRMSDTKASVSVPAISGARKSSSQKKKVRFAATVVEPKNNNREFRLHPRSSGLSRQSHRRLTLDSCEIRS